MICCHILYCRAVRRGYDIGLWGDLPYSDTQAASGMDNLIRDMNSFNLAFTVHDGDIKSGSQKCSNDEYTNFLGYLNRLRAPAAYTPGEPSSAAACWALCGALCGPVKGTWWGLPGLKKHSLPCVVVSSA